jgi:hypothetical protein
LLAFVVSWFQHQNLTQKLAFVFGRGFGVQITGIGNRASRPIGTLDTTASGGPAVDAIILSGAGEDTLVGNS